MNPGNQRRGISNGINWNPHKKRTDTIISD